MPSTYRATPKNALQAARVGDAANAELLSGNYQKLAVLLQESPNRVEQILITGLDTKGGEIIQVGTSTTRMVEWVEGTSRSYHPVVQQTRGLLGKLFGGKIKPDPNSIGSTKFGELLPDTPADTKQEERHICWMPDGTPLQQRIHPSLLGSDAVRPIGTSAAALKGLHPVLLDLPAYRATAEDERACAESIALLRNIFSRRRTPTALPGGMQVEYANNAGFEIASEYIPKDCSRVVVCFPHVHGAADAMHITHADASSAGAFFLHQMHLQQAVEAIMNGLKNKDSLRLFLETWPDALGSDAQSLAYKLEALQAYTAMMEMRAHSDSDASHLHLLSTIYDHSRPRNTALELPFFEARNMLAGKFLSEHREAQLFGDGRVEAARNVDPQERRYDIPHRHLTRSMHKHVAPQDVGVLLYGAAHFAAGEDKGKQNTPPRCGWMEQYMRGIPGMGYLVVRASLDHARQGLNRGMQKVVQNLDMRDMKIQY